MHFKIGNRCWPLLFPTYFEETLSSLANQFDKRFKLYIVDDGSPNPPVELIRSYGSLLDITYKRFADNLGSKSLTAHWMRAINCIDDDVDWIWLLGDDDVLDSGCVREFYCFLDSFAVNFADINLRVIRFSSFRILDNGIKTKVLIQPEKELSTDSFVRKLKGINKSSLSEFVFAAKEIRHHGFYPFPMAWFSDDFALLQCTGFSFIYSVNSASVGVRISDLSISGSKGLAIDKKKSLARFLFFNKVLNDYRQRFKYLDMRLLLRNYLEACLNEKRFFSLFMIFFWAIYYKCFVELFSLALKKSFRILMVKLDNSTK